MKYIKFAVTAMAFLSIMACHNIEINSKPAADNIIIDGLDTNGEWDGKRVYCSKEKIILGFQHDSDYLYVLFISKDEQLEKQMLMNGYTLWLNNNGKSKKQTGLSFPAIEISKNNRNAEKSFRKNDKHDFNENSSQFSEKISLKPEMMNFIKYKEQNMIVSLNELKNFEFARNQDKKGITYEFKIPLNYSESQIFSCNRIDGKNIVIGLECNAPDKENKPEMEHNSGQGRPGGGGGRGGSGGRGMQGNPPDAVEKNNTQSKDYKFWVNVIINPKK